MTKLANTFNVLIYLPKGQAEAGCCFTFIMIVIISLILTFIYGGIEYCWGQYGLWASRANSIVVIINWILLGLAIFCAIVCKGARKETFATFFALATMMFITHAGYCILNDWVGAALFFCISIFPTAFILIIGE